MADAFAQWAARLAAADTSALDELMTAMHVPLLRYATRLVYDRDAAYDIIQEAFIALWSNRATIDPARSLRALMYRIVYTRALNYRRAMNRETTAKAAYAERPPATPATPADDLEARLLGEHVHRWISELPSRRQEAFRLSRFDALSHEEIAEVMGLSRETVTKHIMLALQYVRDRLRAHRMGEAGT